MNSDSEGLTDPALLMGEDEYLRSEPANEARREYVGGLVLTCEPSTAAHSLIGGNILTSLHSAVRQRGGSIYKSAMRLLLVQADETSYLYPDVMVDFSDADEQSTFITEPCLIAEVISAGTRRVDRVYKAAAYLRLPSLQGYLLVDSESRAAELYRKTPSGWQVEDVQGGVELPCVDVLLSLDEMYDGVTF